MKRAKSMKLVLPKGAAQALVVGPLAVLLVAGAGCHSLFESTEDQGDISRTVRAQSLDGGDLDAEGIDGETLDAEALDAEPVDVEPVDVEPIDGGPDAGTGQPDVPLGGDAGAQGDVSDGQIPQSDVRPDGPVVVVDTGAVDTEPIDGGALDVGVGVDGGQAEVGAGDIAPDGQATGAEPGPDTAPSTEVNPDVAVPPNADAAVIPTNDDAAVPPIVTALKYKGGGFCAISSSRAVSPAGFALLALAGLALLRRRRRS